MLDLKTISRAFDSSGMDATSAALDEILRLSQSGEHRQAGEKAAYTMREGVTDIRVVAAFLLGYFEERGPRCLPEVLQTVRGLLADKLDFIRPVSRRPRVIDSALTLLFRSLRASIQFRHAKRDVTWKAWADSITHELSGQIADAADALSKTIGEVLGASQCGPELISFKTRATDVFQRAPAPAPAPAPEPLPAPEPVVEEAAPPASEEPVAEPEEEAWTEPEREPERAASPSGPPPRTIEVSIALEQFIRKLEAFEALVSRGDMGKAAIVAQDVRKIVDRFDPRVYLPALLAPHFRLLSLNINHIAPHLGAEGDPAWEALEQLYQVDLDAFVAA